MANYPPYDPDTPQYKPKVPIKYAIQNALMGIAAIAAMGYGAWRFLGVQPDLSIDTKKISTSHLSPSELYENVHAGMTTADVRTAIGEPEKIVPTNPAYVPPQPERWYYNGGHLEITFQNGFMNSKVTR